MTLPVLYADDYGLHHGDVWYRAHFTAIGSETAWLNGRFIGSSDDATHDFAFPAGSVRAGRDNVLSVMVENMGHNEDFNADDSNKQPRGLTGRLVGRLERAADLADPGQPRRRGPRRSDARPDERLAGRGLVPDRVHAESAGRPGRPDRIRISDDPSRHYRALIYVNGWLIGRYINDTGPETSFPVPAGILRADGRNTVAIGVWDQTPHRRPRLREPPAVREPGHQPPRQRRELAGLPGAAGAPARRLRLVSREQREREESLGREGDAEHEP